MCKGLLISHCHDHGHGHGYGVLGSEVAFLSSFVLISSFQQTIILSISPAFFFFSRFRTYFPLSFEFEASYLIRLHFRAL